MKRRNDPLATVTATIHLQTILVHARILPALLKEMGYPEQLPVVEVILTEGYSPTSPIKLDAPGEGLIPGPRELPHTEWTPSPYERARNPYFSDRTYPPHEVLSDDS